MLVKHKKELFAFGVCVLGIVLGNLLMVYVFERFNIHVPGSREMWIGLIGSIIGGAFTLFGVLFTLYKQEDAEKEKIRLVNMPILVFEVCYDAGEAESVITCVDGELITSGFNLFAAKKFATIKIKTVNNASAFNFIAEECAINGEIISHGDAFNPSYRRIAPEDIATFSFDYDNTNISLFVVVRFSYEDIFGNKYYQDVPFTYAETNGYGADVGKVRQIIEIRDLKQPILVTDDTKDLKEVLYQYQDYETFCVK